MIAWAGCAPAVRGIGQNAASIRQTRTSAGEAERVLGIETGAIVNVACAAKYGNAATPATTGVRRYPSSRLR